MVVSRDIEPAGGRYIGMEEGLGCVLPGCDIVYLVGDCRSP